MGIRGHLGIINKIIIYNKKIILPGHLARTRNQDEAVTGDGSEEGCEYVSKET